VLDKLSRTR